MQRHAVPIKNPIAHFKQLLKKAERSRIPLSNAMCLSTAGRKGAPSSRMMLLKGVDSRGFVFYTNLKSRKARELSSNPRAALCFWWPSLEKQVRVEGKVQRVTDREADRYFATRPRGSQIGAWASSQSAVLASRKILFERMRYFEKIFHGKRVTRPPFWSGFIVQPARIEFWYGREDRLHERYLYTKKNNRWTRTLLNP